MIPCQQGISEGISPDERMVIMDMGKLYAVSACTAGVIFVLFFTFAFGISQGADLIEGYAVERGHAIHAPDTGDFTWLPKGD